MFGDVVGFCLADEQLGVALDVHVPAFTFVDVVMSEPSDLRFDVLESHARLDIFLRSAGAYDAELELHDVVVSVEADDVDAGAFAGDLENLRESLGDVAVGVGVGFVRDDLSADVEEVVDGVDLET